MFSKLWNEGKKEEAKLFGRSIRYITNIKVIKDPANPQNEGKIFLFDMSQTLFDKIKGAMTQTDAMKALGEEPIPVYDPINGNNFLIKVKMGANGILTYEDSKFDGKPSAIYESEEEALKDIKENAHSLDEFLSPENFLSYEELKEKLAWMLGENQETQKPQETQEVKEIKETQKVQKTQKPKDTQKAKEKSNDVADEIDEILDELNF
jgi:hypothetical protein